MLIKLTVLIDVSDKAMYDGYEITEIDYTYDNTPKMRLWCGYALMATLPADLELEIDDNGSIDRVVVDGKDYMFSFKKFRDVTLADCV